MVITSGIGATEQIGELAGALAKAQIEFKSVLKDTNNPFYNSKYADLSSVISATQQSLAKNGLVVIQNPIVDSETEKAGVTTILAHSSGQWMSHDLMLPATMKGKDGVLKFDAQSVGSAITYARRYSYQAIVGVAAEPDDDGNAAVSQSNGHAKPAQDVPKPATYRQESITVSPWENGTVALSGHGLTILAANVEGGLASFATWLAEARLWIIPEEEFDKIKNLAKFHSVSLIRENFPVDDVPAPTAATATNPTIAAVSKKQGARGEFLSVRWGESWHSCFEAKLFGFLEKGKGMSAGLVLSPKNAKGYQNIIGIEYIGNQRFQENAPVS